MAPDFLYPLPSVGVELPDDVGEAVLCVVEKGLEVVLPVSSRVAGCL